MNFSEKRIRRGIVAREFVPFYQPIINIRTRQVVGCEMLARWLTPERGLIQPGQFIHRLRQPGLTEAMTRLLAARMQGDFTERSAELPLCPGFMLTLNVSLHMVVAPLFALWMTTLATSMEKRFGIELVFEITEEEDIRDFPQAETAFGQLAARGVRFAVDDFGTGFAGEELVLASRAHAIKIDRQYIARPGCEAAERFIARVLRLAWRTGARVIAEGVETPAQERWLTALGVEFLQGYRYGRPVPFDLLQYRLGREAVAG